MAEGDGHDITLGEVSRSLVALEGRINEKFANVNRRLDHLQFVPREEHNLQISDLRKDVEELMESRRWIGRTMVVSFIFPIVIAIIVAVVVVK